MQSTTIESLLRDPTLSNKVVLKKLMIAHLQISKEKLMRETELTVSSSDEERIRTGYHQYVDEKIPLEYVLGYVAFLERRFHVNGNTLIPRPETEYMILAVKEALEADWGKRALLDLGCGCGVLGASVYAELPDQIESVLSTDISDGALAVAEQNLTTFVGSSELFRTMKSDMLAEPAVVEYVEWADQLCIVANLPYIPDELFDTNTDEWVKKREPRMAFVGGDDGLDYYRIMFAQLAEMSRPPTLTMFLEMMTRQAEKLEQEYAGQLTFTFVKTFHCNIRIVEARFA